MESVAESLLSFLGTLWMIAKVAIGIGFVIFIHELGHYLAAKFCGVKVEKFLVGFDVPIRIGRFRLPSTLWRKQGRETFYAIGIIPLGGYVKMLGQDDNPANYQKEAERTRVRASDAESEADPSHRHEDVIHGGMVAMGSQEDERGEHVEPLENVGHHGDDSAYTVDPRSYTAKSVPARMFIISAGVIMNVISAVFMGAAAYGLGVAEMPAIIAGTSPGSPAWTGSSQWGEIAHLKAGDKIVQIGREGEPYEYLRFDDDLMFRILLNGVEKEMELLIERDGERHWVSIQPRLADSIAGAERPTLGVVFPRSLVLAETPTVDHFPAGKAEPAFEADDKIVAVNGEEVADYAAFQTFLARHASEPLTITVERQAESKGSAPQRVDIRVAANLASTLGVAMRPGPLVAVQAGSPAEEAGLKAGDVLLQIDGSPIGDPMTLGERLQPRAGEEIEIVVERDGKELPLRVTPRLPEQIAGPYADLNAAIGVEELGVAFQILNEVSGVEPGGPAEKAGLQEGDKLTQVQFLLPENYTPPTEDEEKTVSVEEYTKPIQLDSEHLSWPFLHTRLQEIIPGTTVKLDYLRDGKTASVKLAPAVSEGSFMPERGVRLTLLSRTRTASSFGEAMALGARECKERFYQVLAVLGKLLSGQVSPTNLVGPAGIAYVAGAKAQLGLGDLLLFLTFLSINLAVINSLPIPVLDGGHFFFLLIEGIRGKPVSERWVIPLTMAGLIFLLSLMLFVTVMDIGRFTGIVR